MTEKVIDVSKNLGVRMAELFKLILLYVAGLAIAWAAVMEVWGFIGEGGPGLGDVLMLFLLIELAAMVAIYFRTNRLAVRYLVYIAITALTRVLVVDVKYMENWTVITIVGAIFMLTLGVLALRGSDYWFGGADEEQKD